MKEVVSNQKPLNETVMIVRSHDAVDLLLNVQAARHLAPFMRTEQSLGSAAAELGRRPSSLAYWVDRFVRAGLLSVVREQPRAGKAIPFYRATADEFQVPFDSMSPGTAAEFLHGARKVMAQQFATSVERAARDHFTDGIRVTGHAERGMAISFIEPKDGGNSPVTEWWGNVSLTKAEAAGLQDEMEALVGRYSNDHPSKGRSSYLIMVGITPTRD